MILIEYIRYAVVVYLRLMFLIGLLYVCAIAIAKSSNINTYIYGDHHLAAAAAAASP